MENTMKNSEKRVRVILDFSKQEAAEIDELVEVCDLGTRTAFVRDANALFKWAIGELQSGRKVGSWDDGFEHIKEPVMPSLQMVVKRK